MTRIQHDGLLLIGIVILFALIVSGFSDAEPKGTLTTETYTVQHNDTLWAISRKYMEKNTYGPREIREFYHGIIELNWDTVFKDRPDCMIYPGDKLKINYFVK